MKNRTLKKPRKHFLKLFAVIAFVLVACVALLTTNYRFNHPGNTATPVPGKLTTSQKQSVAQDELNAKKTVVENTKPATTSPNADSPPPQAQNIDLSAKRESNNSVTVFTKLTGVSNGTCSLSVQNGSSSYLNSADIIYQTEYSTCAGFSVPIEKLGSGTWNISLTVTSGGQSYSKIKTFKVD